MEEERELRRRRTKVKVSSSMTFRGTFQFTFLFVSDVRPASACTGVSTVEFFVLTSWDDDEGISPSKKWNMNIETLSTYRLSHNFIFEEVLAEVCALFRELWSRKQRNWLIS